MTDPSTPDDDPNTDPRAAFEAQTWNALASAMQATYALWQIYSALQTENRGGGVSWDRIEDNVWEANESIGFARTYVKDDIGVVAQYQNLTEAEADADDLLTVYVNNVQYDVPKTTESPDEILRAANYDPADYVLYWTDPDLGSIHHAPFAFDAGDKFLAIPKETRY